MTEYTVKLSYGVVEMKDGSFRPVIAINGAYTVYEFDIFLDKEKAKLYAKEEARAWLNEWANKKLDEGYSIDMSIYGDKP